MQALIQEAKEENDNNQNDDFKKTIGFHDQNISHARASRFLDHFFDVHCMTTTWILQTWCFMEDVDIRPPIFLPLFELE